MTTIPENVLGQIVTHRPQLAGLVRNLRAAPEHLQGVLEKRLADAYLLGRDPPGRARDVVPVLLCGRPCVWWGARPQVTRQNEPGIERGLETRPGE